MEVKGSARVNNFGRIGVLMGGPSSEREISLRSGRAVCQALMESGLDVVPIDIRTDKANENVGLIRKHKIDCAFLALHGRFGEDGQIQKLLEKIKLPYTGSGVRSSALAMDKIASRKLFEKSGLNVPRYIMIKKSSYAASGKIKHNFNFSQKSPGFSPWDECILFSAREGASAFRPRGSTFPLVIKPTAHGSSIGLSIIERENDLKKALDLAFSFDERVIVEEYIKGREMTVGILDQKALPVIEISPKKMFFDYEAKYHPGMSEYIVPAKIEDRVSRKIRKTALLAHNILGCFGCSRVDIILRPDKKPFVLEVNTIPGMTSTSLLPKAAKVAGIEFNELCLTLIKLAYEKKRA